MGRRLMVRTEEQSIEEPFSSLYSILMTTLLTTRDVSIELGITPRRVQSLISSGRLRANRIGRDWLIDPSDIESVRHRPPGRPRTKNIGK